MGMVGSRLSEASNLARGASEKELISGAVLVRWRRQEGRWAAINITPVSPLDNSFEPSVVRDRDGSLLFCVREGREPDNNDVRICGRKTLAVAGKRSSMSEGSSAPLPFA